MTSAPAVFTLKAIAPGLLGVAWLLRLVSRSRLEAAGPGDQRLD